MRLGTLLLLLAVASTPAFAENFDPAYYKLYGKGVILASAKDYPPFDKCDPTLVDFKKPTSFIPVGSSKFDIRVILPEGQDAKTMVTKLKAERPENVKYQDGDDQVFWEFWVSHNSDGTPRPEAAAWPTKAAERPQGDPKHEANFGIPDGDPGTTGIKWMDLSAGLYDFLPVAKPGWKIYVAVSVGFTYKAGAGETESKWNPDKKKFENVVSTGALGYVKSDPIVAGFIEFK